MKCKYIQTKFRMVNGSKVEFEHRCGQCLQCRILKRSEKATRLHLESLLYPGAASMVTFTYNDENKPEDGSVDPREFALLRWRILSLWRNYWKKFPQYVQADNYHQKLRFYAVGEYGDQSMRPHYHVAIFGLPVDMIYTDPDSENQKKYNEICRTRRFSPVLFPGLEQFLLKAWQYRGHVSIEQLDDGLSSYMTGYVTKKMTAFKDLESRGLKPEFASGSPGLGVGYAPIIADAMKSKNLVPKGYAEFHNGAKQVEWSSLIRINGKKRPLDAFMRRKIIKHLGGQEYDPDKKRRRAMMRSMRIKHKNTLTYGEHAGAVITIEERGKERYRVQRWHQKAKLASKSKKI